VTLAAGSKLGPYEILAPLGAGGMGEVYRARDTKLDRDVAVKVLPERLGEDPGALARFEREAKTVAALSHPNLLGIYDFGRHEGVTYAVTELLSGETLREKLAAAAIPQRKAIEYALQIARGLAAAHESGIVHRDLKPENVFVTNDGRVKILDFGLAKAGPAEGPGTDAFTVGATEPGTVMGTVGYMSPEQVRGRPADHRSDIFSFGAILYEMLSGRRAFKGDSAVETMNAILTKDLAEPAEIGGGLPPLLDRIVRHCLEKNPEERFQSARDVAFDLETVSGTTSGTTRQLIAPAPSKLRFLLPAAAVAAAAFVGLGYLAGRKEGVPRPASEAAPTPVSFSQQTDQQGVESFPALSPDGKTLVFVSRASGNEDLYLQRIGGRNPLNLTKDSPDDDTQPAFSPDGSSIAFRSDRAGGGIFLMGAMGESVRRVTESGFHPAWSPDGKEIAFTTEATLHPMGRGGSAELRAVEVASGRVRLLFRGDGVQPSWSPHGDRIAYWAVPPGSGQRDLWTISAGGVREGTAPVPVTNDAAVDWNPVWSADGKFLYFGSDRGGSFNLWRIAIDEKTGQPAGAPTPLTTPALWAGQFTVSRDGRQIAYLASTELAALEKLDFDPSTGRVAGQLAPLLRVSFGIMSPALSPDGQWIVFRSSGRQEDLALVRSDGTGLRQLTDDAHRDRGPSWSPDGRQIAFYSNRGGRYQIWTIHPDGSGLTSVSNPAPDGYWFPFWSPDGKRLAFPDGKQSYLLDVETDAARRIVKPLAPFPEPASWFHVTSWSPDGKLLAGHTAQKGGIRPNGLAFYTVETGRYERLTDAGNKPLWLPDGRRLLYHDKRQLLVLDVATRESRVVLPASPNGEIIDFALSADGRSIHLVRSDSEGDVWALSFQ